MLADTGLEQGVLTLLQQALGKGKEMDIAWSTTVEQELYDPAMRRGVYR
jgi:hypothetical protein